jgi:hypothetical protein
MLTPNLSGSMATNEEILNSEPSRLAARMHELLDQSRFYSKKMSALTVELKDLRDRLKVMGAAAELRLPRFQELAVGCAEVA